MACIYLLARLVQSIEKRGAYDIAAKVRQWLGVIFDEAFDRGEVEQNVTHNLKPSVHSSGAVSRHHPFIPLNELPDLLEAVDNATTHQLIKIAINLLILTAVRPSELRFAEWQEFDLVKGVWNVPAERIKMRRPHTIPLTSQAIELLQQVKAVNPEGYLFVLRGDKPYSENTVNKV